MQTSNYLLAWHLPILNIIVPPSYTLILSYNHFSLYFFIATQNLFLYSSTLFSAYISHLHMTLF